MNDSDSNSIADKYVEALKHFDNLFALWKPDSESEIQPGSCGYFDTEGDWHTIVNLRDSEEAIKFNYESASPEPKEKALGKWGPVCSKNIRWKRVMLEDPVELPNTEFKLKLEFSKDEGFGAALVTGPTVAMKFFQHPKKLFHTWAKTNYSTIAKEFPDVKDHDLWIITKTCITSRCAISTWDDSASSSSLYASAAGLVGSTLTFGGEVGVKRESSNVLWRILPDYEGDSEGLWKCVKGEGFLASNHRDRTPPLVVFIGGLRYRRYFGLVWPVAVPDHLRGEKEESMSFEVKSVDGESIRVVCEDWNSESRKMR